MNQYVKKTGAVLVFTFCFLGCQQNNNCTESGNLIAYHNSYNVANWRPFIDERVPKDSLLQQKLLSLSILIGDLARDAIDKSGGFNIEDNSLLNPNSVIVIGESELNQFYSEINFILTEINKNEKYSALNEELNSVFKYNFFIEDGGLSYNNLRSTNIELISSKLLFFENYCYFLIVKYA